MLLVVVVVAWFQDGPPTPDHVSAGDEIESEAYVAPDVRPAAVGEVHFTFDDGPSLTNTGRILDVLAKHDATAVFFPIGNQVAGGAELLRRAVADGHRIGNHTWNHDSLDGISAAGFDATVGQTQAAIERATGVVPRCLRPPKGAIDADTRARAAELGMSVELWTVDPQDWRRPGGNAITLAVLDKVDDGDVVLLHDGGGSDDGTIAALDAILGELAGRGFRFTAIPGC